MRRHEGGAASGRKAAESQRALELFLPTSDTSRVARGQRQVLGTIEWKLCIFVQHAVLDMLQSFRRV